MVVASGSIPYAYSYGNGPFHVPNPYGTAYPIGPSGILLEQAQFVITAEYRKWTFYFDPTFLPDFFIYNNFNTASFGPYEPRADGTTLANFPAGLFLIDHIGDTRTALEQLLSTFSDETDHSSDEYKAAWLQALYPNHPSGFKYGDYSHRFPSETGIIDYTCQDVLGASGVLYDVDFGELMFNPVPQQRYFSLESMHGSGLDGKADLFMVQQHPIWPAFQKLDGSIVPLTGHEPSFIRGGVGNNVDYNIDHMSSGDIRLDGNTLLENTKFYLGRTGDIFDTTTPSFSIDSQGLRAPLSVGGNMENARLFLSPTSQGSGVYRIAGVNHRSDYPTTTIESGAMSFWPTLAAGYGQGSATDLRLGVVDSQANLGYHVFDDCMWVLDITRSRTNVSRTQPSGLCMLSPWTGHPLWLRYADMRKNDFRMVYEYTIGSSTQLTQFNTSGCWSTAKGLIRTGNDEIYRAGEYMTYPYNVGLPRGTPGLVFPSSSGQVVFAKYDDELNLIDVIVSTSDCVDQGPDATDLFPIGGGGGSFNGLYDIWNDPNSGDVWVSNWNAGFGMWRFDASFKYQDKYLGVADGSSAFGTQMAAGVFIDGDMFLYNGWINTTPSATILDGSGLWPATVTGGSNPHSGTSATCGTVAVDSSTVKYINGAPRLGTITFAQILHVIQVNGATHLKDGVYALVWWGGLFIGNIYLLRIEEGTDFWEIVAMTEVATGVATSDILIGTPNAGYLRRLMLFMGY